jgi:hypothetical protein
MKNFYLWLVFLFAFAAHGQRYVRTFNTADEAWNANLNDVHTNIFILHRSTVNDGGGGQFWYEKNATTATNLGTVWGNTNGGRLFRVWDTEVIPQWFGANDSLTADAAPQLQAAIDFAARPTYGWQGYAGQSSTPLLPNDLTKYNGSFKVKAVGAFALYSPVEIKGGVLLEGKPGSSSGDFGGHTVFHSLHGGDTFFINTGNPDWQFRIGGIRDVNIVGRTQTYQPNKKAINTVVSRYQFKVADADAPPTLDDQTIWPSHNTCFFYDPNGEYLGSARILSTSSSAGLTTVNLWQDGTDAYTGINNSAGLLTTSCKVVWPVRITNEFPSISGNFTDPSVAGPVGVNIKNTSTLTGSPYLENIFCWNFHTGFRFGPGNVFSAAPYKSLRSVRHKFAGIAVPRPDNTTDIVVDGLTYVSGYYNLDFGQTLPVGDTVTVSATSPAVFTKVGHGFTAGTGIRLGATGSMPGGFTAGTVYPGKMYYVQSTGLTADTFQVSDSFVGTSVNASSTGSGVYIAGSAISQPALQYGAYGIWNAPTFARFDTTVAEFSAYANVYASRIIAPHFKYLFCDGTLRHGLVLGAGYAASSPPTTSHLSDWVSVDHLVVKPGLPDSPHDTYHTNTVAVFFEKPAGTGWFAGVSINQFSAMRSLAGGPQFTHAFDLQPAAYANRAKVGMIVENNGYAEWRNPTGNIPEVDAPNMTQATDVGTGWYRPSWTQRDFAVSGTRLLSLTSGNVLVESSTGSQFFTLKNTANSQDAAFSIGNGTFSIDNTAIGIRHATFFSDTNSTTLFLGASGKASGVRASSLRPESAAAGGTDVPGSSFYIYGSPGTGAATGGGDIQFVTPDVGASGTAIQSMTVKARFPRYGGIHMAGIASDPFAIGLGHVYPNSTTRNFRFFDGSYWQPLSLQADERNVASASTVNLGFQDSDKIYITGTTTINSFGAALGGTRRNVRFEGVLTLTYNATSMILPGGTSIITAANDTLEAQCISSGNWRVVWYQRASGAALVSSGGVSDGDKGDITVSGSGATYTIDNSAVTYAKMQNVSAVSKLLGRNSGTTGPPEEITLGSGLTMTGSTLSASGGGGVTDGDKGDITVTGSGATWTVDATSITYAKMQNVSTASKLIGRGSSGSGSPQEITLGSGFSMAATTLSYTIPDNDYGDISIAGGVWSLDNSSVTLAKMADMNHTRLLGRKTASGIGAPEEVTISDGLDWTAGSAPAFGDVLYRGASSWARLAPGTSGQILQTQGIGASPQWASVNTSSLANNAVSNAKLATMSSSTIKARASAGTGDPEDITLSQLLDLVGSAAQGDILYRGASSWSRLPSGQLGNFLRSGGTSADPAWDIGLVSANQYCLADDFTYGTVGTSTGFWTVNGANVTQAGAQAVNRPGVLQFTTAASATGTAFIHNGISTYVFGGGAVSLEFSARLTTVVPDGTETYALWMGFHDNTSANTATDGAYFLLTSASANWQTVTAKASTRTSNTTTVGPTVNTWQKFRIDINAACTSITFYIDGTLVATHTTNLPDTTSNNSGVMFNILKSLGTTARIFQVDYVKMSQQFTTSR